MNLDRKLGATPTEHDSPTEHDGAVADRFAGQRLRRLIHTAIGLSDDSIDLLTAMTSRLRAAEGMLSRDPLDEY
ncbi:hypothetical protein OHA40_23205 [Nocardia sp. NBC_00508]|uniref:hypothetical protein n=1 Tax=Nocardia sp. NBC_00508 TaxID=2975992 RepID=UPI002E818E61|nr:hypothetical protein [Nocardia sp. NBC_00508]WUD64578.1 hypothetical protein OHA40_23205 [Nocardia sp. NBC_00508]